MKRILAILLAALMLACVFVACDQSEPAPEQPTAAPTEGPTTEAPTEAPTEEPTTDDGEPEPVEYYVDCYEERTRTPEAINATSKGVGFTFTIASGYITEVSVAIPSYSDDFGSLTMKVYAWDTDYDTTVAKEPVYSEEFVDFPDNSTQTVYFEDEQIGAGTYLVLMCDGVDEVGQGVGVWCNGIIKDEYLLEEYGKYNIQSYINGKQNKKKIGEFSFVHVDFE